MEVATLNRPRKKNINWINSSERLTLEEYRDEMLAAENSDFISFEDHKKNMNQWLR